MSGGKDKKKRLAEYLWTEINKAILKSPDVQFSIKKLEKLQLLDHVAEFNLVLEVDKLIESILQKGAEKEAKSLDMENLKKEFLETKANSSYEETQLHDEPELETLEKKLSNISSPFSSQPPTQWVDGKALSEYEILFEEYLKQGFDEKKLDERS